MDNPIKDQLFKLIGEVKAVNPLNTSRLAFFGTKATVDYAKEHDLIPDDVEIHILPDFEKIDEIEALNGKLFVLPIKDENPIRIICEEKDYENSLYSR